jgi:hypothetical protein
MRFTNPELQDWELFPLLDNCLLILVFINSKPIIGEYISTGEDYQSIKVLGKSY